MTQNQIDTQKRRAIRRQVLIGLGGYCVCCGESRKQFLTIDHIYGGGEQHRKHRHTQLIYKDIIKAGFPKDKYRILCMKCNFSIGHYGYCPQVSPSMTEQESIL
jgi:hypothetical protein